MTRMNTNKDKKLYLYNSRNSYNSCNSLTPFLILLIIFLLLSCNVGDTDNNGNTVWGDTWDTAQPLKDIYKKKFLMGNIISPSDLNNNAVSTIRFNYLKRHFNTLTAENHMKPDNIAPRTPPDSDDWNYQWTSADNIVAAAEAAKMNVVGHTLIWHSQTPAWLTTGTKEIVENNLNKYVTEVVDHFKGKLISWDVVNEAMRDGLTASDTSDGKWKTCLRPLSGNRWAIVDDYIEKAFLAARAADPDVKLYYNDYNLNDANKARAVYNMVNDINTRHGKIIDGIGMQSHHNKGTDPKTVDTSIKLFASLGVEVAISELDILTTTNLTAVPWNEDDIKTQAKRYALMFEVFKNNASNISRVTFWGIDDGTSWRKAYFPTLLDENYKLKPAFYAVTNPNPNNY